MSYRRKPANVAAQEQLVGDDPDDDNLPDFPWHPPVKEMFYILFAAKLLSAALSNISDCDETFNYWEPTHFLVYGHGLQTWEYSPTYALRSYFYLMPHAAVVQLCAFIFEHKIHAFYATRCVLGFMSAACEVMLYKALCRNFPLSTIPNWTMFFCTVCSGMFAASTAFLPSTFAMYLVTLGGAMWLWGRPELMIFAVGIGALVGWPFAAAVGLPWGAHVLYTYGFRRTLMWATAAFAGITVPMLLVDSQYYGKTVFAWWNIIFYNVLGGGGAGGSELYGTEPWYFYLLNGFLNFNFVFLLALISPLVTLFPSFKLLTKGRSSYARLMILPIFVWLGILVPQPHKEERFLFVIYPLICVAAAISVSVLLYVAESFAMRLKSYSSLVKSIVQVSVGIFVVTVVALSVSRTYAQYTYYHAPLDVYQDFLENELGYGLDDSVPFEGKIVVCVGKEWYRFPSHFFLPDRARLRFLKSSFDGLLPKSFATSGLEGTRAIPTHMNNENREEPTRYLSEDQCDYIIDLDLPHQAEKHYLGDDGWEVVASSPFLDASQSPRLTRAFYIPFLSSTSNVFADYVVLRKKGAH